MKNGKNNDFRALLPAPILLILMLLSSVSLSAQPQYPDVVLALKKTIKAKMILSHIDFLASKFCRGREVGDNGMDLADKYISTVLAGAEIAPSGDNGAYFQNVRLHSVDISDRTGMTITTGNISTDARLEWDFLPMELSAEAAVAAPLVFAGYGITAPEHRYDDYKNLDVRGKIVLVMRHEPGEKDPKSPFDGVKTSKHGVYLEKILNAQRHGAAAILFVTDPLNHQDLSLDGDISSSAYWPSLRKKRMEKHEDVQFMRFSHRLKIEDDNFGVRIPAAIVSGTFAQNMLGDRSLLELQKQLDQNYAVPRSAEPPVKVSLNVYFNYEKIPANNIVFKIEGGDPVLKNEAVIVGAHYDHTGKNNKGEVFGGADDNASGSAVCIELARAFQNLTIKPKRTILFVLFTAEEKGLLGSRYYIKKPIFPLDKTLGYVNLDMVGRNDASQLSIMGKYQYPKFFSIVEEVNRNSANFEFNFSIESYISSSDQFPFMREGIPSIFFTSGTHDEYHTPRDTAGRIVADKVEKVAQLVFLTVWRTADLPAGTQLK